MPDPGPTPGPGVPLGGVGTGSITLCEDGYFRRIGINNNRREDALIPELPRSFLAVCARRPGHTYARRLVVGDTNEQPDGSEPPALRPGQLRWRALYPAAHFRLVEEDAPVAVTWSAFSPLIPFDHDASTTPAILISVLVRNVTQEPVELALALNWENCLGRTAAAAPAALPPIAPANIDPFEDEPAYRKSLAAAAGQGGEGEGGPTESRFNALTFGDVNELPSDAHGQYCVAVRPLPRVESTVTAWDSSGIEERERFWRRFTEEGSFARFASGSSQPAEGAVCARVLLAPEQAYRADFVFAWYCPVHTLNGTDYGNRYTNKFPDAVSVAKHCMKHTEYLFTAVENWQRRFARASVPSWLGTLLIESSHVFSTNTLATRDGHFAMLTNTNAPRAGDLGAHLYSSFGSLLFFPRFEEMELLLIAHCDPESIARRICRDLGPACFDAPAWEEAPGERLLLGCKLVLLTYRNFFLSGKLVRLLDLLPVLEKLMAALLALDSDGDGLPDVSPGAVTYDGLASDALDSPTATLWLATLCAYGKLARTQNAPHEAARYEAVFARARTTFNERYWDEDAGCYLLTPRVTGTVGVCHTSQLLGQWFADFMQLGDLVPPARIARALDTILRLNSRPQGLAAAHYTDGTPLDTPGAPSTHAWPLITGAFFAPQLLYRGRAAEALRLVEHYATTMVRGAKRRYRAPQRWDLRADAPAPDNPESDEKVLGVWHVLYALQGFLLNVPEGRLTLMPNLPAGTDSLSAPLFTPMTFGWVKFREEPGPPYRQQVHLAFDSPLRIQTLELRVPMDVRHVELSAESGEGPEQFEWRLEPHHEQQRLVLRARNMITLREALRLHIVAVPVPTPAARRGL